MGDVQTVTLLVSGRVQGVYFRQSTCTEAQRLGLVGSVRNLSNGQVEVVAQGAREGLEALIAYCHHGPPLARVDDVVITWHQAHEQRYQTFSVRHH